MPKRKQPPQLAEHTWEQPPTHVWDEDSESTSDDGGELPSGEDACTAFIDVVLTLLLSGTLSAKTCRLLFFCAARAGLRGCHRFGVRPGAATGTYQRHLDSVLGVKLFTEQTCTTEVPVYNKRDVLRDIRQMPVQPPHEAIHEDRYSGQHTRPRLGTFVLGSPRYVFVRSAYHTSCCLRRRRAVPKAGLRCGVLGREPPQQQKILMRRIKKNDSLQMLLQRLVHDFSGVADDGLEFESRGSRRFPGV